MTLVVNEQLAVFEQVSDTLYEHSSPEGYVVAEYNAQTGNFYVADIFVEPDQRNRGAGRELLGYAHELAIHLGAQTILATIASRESYEMFRRFYGSQYLKVHSLGTFADYTPKAETKVSLSYSISQK